MKLNNIIFIKKLIIYIIFLIIAINQFIFIIITNSIIWTSLEFNETNPVLKNINNLITKREEDHILESYPFFDDVGLKKKDRYNSYLFLPRTNLYLEFPPLLKQYFNCTDLDGNIATITFKKLYPNQIPHLEIYFDQFYDFLEKHIPSTVDPSIPRVLHSLEPPIVRYCSVRENCIKYFNWSVGYEEWADIRLNHGTQELYESIGASDSDQHNFMNKKIQFIEKRKNQIKNNLFNDTFMYSIYNKETDDLGNVKNQFILEKYLEYDETPIASWFCSSCGTNESRSNRYQVVQEMMKYVRIDSYGNCLKNIPTEFKYGRARHNAIYIKQETISNYKFYLSFENCNCVDYITEKALHALSSNTVPVIMGHPQILKYLPPGSFIYVGDFKNVKELVYYLKYLNSNDQEYLKYFEWKKNKQVISEFKLNNGYPNRPNSASWICPLFNQYQKWKRGLINNKSLNQIKLNNICLLNNTINI